MKLHTRPFLLVMGLLILSGGIFLFVKRTTVLHVKNLDHARTLSIRTDPSGDFSMFYINSIYDEPVSEEFQIKGDAIILKAVRTKSPAVIGYYGFDDSQELHLVNKNLGAAFIIKMGMLDGQGLWVGEKKVFLHEIGEKGDSIQLSAEIMPLGFYFLRLQCSNKR